MDQALDKTLSFMLSHPKLILYPGRPYMPFKEVRRTWILPVNNQTYEIQLSAKFIAIRQTNGNIWHHIPMADLVLNLVESIKKDI